MGTELWDLDGTMVWGGQLDAIIQSLCYRPRALYLTSVRPGRVIDSIKSRALPDLHVYKGILSQINELGYEDGVNFVAFGYDWRQSNAVSAGKLAGFMRAQIENGTERFIILAHSMGGLVARLMLRDEALAKRVERYV
jgi:pimeloyl-ACP methyl ester carboxylesterase